MVLGSVVPAVGVIIKLIGESKHKISNSSIVSKNIEPQTLAPQLRFAEEETTYPADQDKDMPQRKQWAEVAPKLTYQVVDEGQGETMSKHRQGCFQYKEAGSVEDISFEGSPTELSIKLGPGFEDEMLEAIVGMKSNGRRIIFIPRENSS
ncbi:hypothetical protein ACFE04_026324 [Oxalis oulophora]